MRVDALEHTTSSKGLQLMPTSHDTNDAKPIPQDTLITTHHTITIDGQEIAYTVTCGTVVLKETAVMNWRRRRQS